MAIASLLRAPITKPRKSRPTKPTKEPRGLSPTDPALATVVTHAWRNCFATRSDYARQNAEAVAMAACLGLITTSIDKAHYGQTWRITGKGLHMLEGDQP